jgi:hypothetical protein
MSYFLPQKIRLLMNAKTINITFYKNLNSLTFLF